jgi:hypothetical protein
MKIFVLSMQKTILLVEMRKHQLTFVNIYKMKPVMKTILAKTRKMSSKSLIKMCHTHSPTNGNGRGLLGRKRKKPNKSTEDNIAKKFLKIDCNTPSHRTEVLYFYLKVIIIP